MSDNLHPVMDRVLTRALRAEPAMEFCPICEVCTEVEDMVDVLVLGSDGETERMCRSCADVK